MSDTHDTDDRRDLDRFANTGGQPNQPMQQRPPSGHSLVKPTTGLAERTVGAIKVEVKRDLGRMRQQIVELAAMAGEDWFYRYPVRTKDGGQDWIDGPTIKLTNAVANLYMNNALEIREVDVGDAWVFYARFTDFENGTIYERAFRQRKGQLSMKTKDADRQLDIAYQIGQSKALRNVVRNAIGIYVDFAHEEAHQSLVGKIGKDIEKWRTKTVDGFQRLGIDLKRAERVIGRAAKEWLAGDISRLLAMGKAIADGMATVDESFPPIEAPKEEQQQKSADQKTTAETKPAERGSATAGESETKKEQAEKVQPKTAKSGQEPNAPKTAADYLELCRTTAAANDDPGRLSDWFASDAQRRLRSDLKMSAEETRQAQRICEDRIAELEQ